MVPSTVHAAGRPAVLTEPEPSHSDELGGEPGPWDVDPIALWQDEEGSEGPASGDGFAPGGPVPDGQGGTRPSGAPSMRRAGKGRLRPLRAALVVVVVGTVVAGLVGYLRVDHDISPPGRPGKVVTVSVARGSSTMHIANVLASDGVIHGPDVFALWVKLKGDGPLLAGTYQMRRNESYASVVSQLQKGPVVVTYKLVIPEGYTVRQIATDVGALGVGITASAFLAAARSDEVRSPFEPGTTTNLEGFLFPATYPVPRGETALKLVRWMVRTFDDEASSLGLAHAAARLHYTPYQVLEVASIVEREAKLDQDLGPVASVIYNRLAKGTPIGAESTLLYGLGEPTGPVSITTPNRYNTLIYKGLPPTPISNPGTLALQAAMAPPHTPYLYFVEVNPDGKMGYATDNAQFRQLQHECRVVHLC